MLRGETFLLVPRYICRRIKLSATKRDDESPFRRSNASEVSVAFPLTGAFHWFLEMLKTFSSLVRCDMQDISRNQWEVAEDKRSPGHAVSTAGFLLYINIKLLV